MNDTMQIEIALIGKSIKALRKANNLTQEELANRCGYSIRNLRRIENYGTASIDVINTFALIFKVKAIDILNGCFLKTKSAIVQPIADFLSIIPQGNRQHRISSYTFYFNLLFIHMHFRLNYKELLYNF